jgi:t-SNARE complex subunit (syntaxin)
MTGAWCYEERRHPRSSTGLTRPSFPAADRLAELRGGAARDIEMGSPSAGAGTSSSFMTAFFEEVQGIKIVMGTIRANISRIEQLHGEALSAISSEQGKAANMALEAETKRTNSMAQNVRAQLKAMDSANKDFGKRNAGASEARIRLNMHSTLTRKFVDLMAEYQEVQTKYKSKYRERVERQYKIVKPSVTKEEIDAALDSEPGSQPEVFTQTILQGPGHAQAKNALADIQDKHRDIIRLEASIAELHQLFLDMSVLVESQGELLDQIEYTVAQSVDYTGRAVDELRSAAKYQKRVRRRTAHARARALLRLRPDA